MIFEIPQEHADWPEAKRLLKIDAEFKQVCAKQHEAVTAKLYESDPTAFEELGKAMRALQQSLKEAKAAYDEATGGPTPVTPPSDVLRDIEQQFTPVDREEVIATLSNTLGYLRQQRIDDHRIASYLLRLADGSKQRLMHYADEAKADFRNIIFWVENPDESRLDTAEKIEKFQQTLEWLGEKREPELEKHKRALERQDMAGQATRPWWRFW